MSYLSVSQSVSQSLTHSLTIRSVRQPVSQYSERQSVSKAVATVSQAVGTVSQSAIQNHAFLSTGNPAILTKLMQYLHIEYITKQNQIRLKTKQI